MPVVLYGCETWSLPLREELRLKVFESIGVRETRKQGSGEDYITRNFVLCTLRQILFW